MKKLTFFLALACFLGQAHFVHAASFSFSPDNGRYAVGDTVTVHVDANAEGVPINAVSGTIDFPSNLLSLNSVSKTGSQVNFWTVDPAADGSSVHFEGVILNPGYSGSKGLLITLTFTVKAAGTAKLAFHSAAILANDGLGTNVLSNTYPGTYTFVPQTLKDQPAQTVSDNLPDAPIVTSSTHPNPLGWYQNNTPLISWMIPKDITGVTLLIDQTSNTNPGTRSYGRITGYDIATLSDGVWYAHIRFSNESGWGAITHYRLGIDTIPPTDLAVVQVPNDADASSARFNLSAKDSGSGIDHYSFVIDGAPAIIVPAADSWQTKVLSSGDHTLLAEVFDKAGNSITTKAAFTTSGINAPTIDVYPAKLHSGNTLTVSGHTYPNATVTMTVDQDLSNSYFFGSVIDNNKGTNETTTDITADTTGAFTFTSDKKVKSGSYTVTASATLGKYKSLPSTGITIPVTPSFFERLIQFIMHFFGFVILLILIALGYIIYRYRRLKKKMDHDLHKIEESVRSQIGGVSKTGESAAQKQKDMVFLEKLEVDIKNAELDVETPPEKETPTE